MRALKLTLFILTFFCLCAELIRHTYVRWLENHHSVLDQYDEVRVEIKEATSLADIERRYAEELGKARAAAKAKPKTPTPACEEYDPRPENQPPVSELGEAIRDWERRENEIREMRYFWLCGLALLVLALLCHWRQWSWLSLTLLIAGFSEMTWWTSPWIGLSGSAHEFARMLDNKIALTVLALALLLAFWFTRILHHEEGR